MVPAYAPMVHGASPKLPRLPVLRRDRAVLSNIHGAAVAMDLPHPWAFADRKLPPIERKQNLDSLRKQAKKLPPRPLVPPLPGSRFEDARMPGASDTGVWRTGVLAADPKALETRASKVLLPPLDSMARALSMGPTLSSSSSASNEKKASRCALAHSATTGLSEAGSPTSSPATRKSRGSRLRLEQGFDSPPSKRGSRSRSSKLTQNSQMSPMSDASQSLAESSPGAKTPNGLPVLDRDQLERIFVRYKEPHSAEMLAEHLPLALKHLGFHDLDQEWLDEIKESVVGLSSFMEKPEFLEAMEKYRDRHVERLAGEFATFDLNGNGEIDSVELTQMLENLNITVIPGIVRELLQEITGRANASKANLGAYLRLREIISHRGGFTKDESENLKDLFERYDASGDGYMDLEELESALKWLGLSLHHGSIRRGSQVVQGGQRIMAAPQLKRLLEGLDYDEEKGLGFEDFLMVMRRHREMEIGWARQLFLEMAEDFSTDDEHDLAIDLGRAVEVVHTLGYITVTSDVLKECAEDIGCLAEVPKINFDEFYMIFRRVRMREGFQASELDEFQDAFSLHDTDGSGAVDVVELGGALRWMGYPVTVEEQKLLMDDVDVDKSGELDYDEFLKVMRWYKEEEIKRVKKAFDYEDDDHRNIGTLARDQVIFFLCGLGPHIATDKTVNEMVKEVCGDDEYIRYEEVLAILNALHAQCCQVFRENYGFHGEELRNLQDLFAKHDRADSGEITRQDISNLLLELFPEANSREGRETAAEVLAKVDKDGDGKLEFTEFLHLMRLVQDRTEHASVLHEQKVAANCGFSRGEVADLRKVFKLCDTDGSKTIEADEMIEMMSTMGVLTAEKRIRVKHIFKEVDEDETESLNFAQFLTLMRRVYDESLLPQIQ